MTSAPSAPDAPAPVPLFGLALDPITLDQAVERCRRAVESRERLLVGVVNAAKVVSIGEDVLLRDSLLECDMVLADGQSVVWAGGVLGHPLPERVAGIDLFEALLGLADADGRSVYLFGATQEVLEKVVAEVGRRWPNARVAGARNGYFDEADSEAVAAEIRDSGADMAFLGISSPIKERFLARHADTLGVPVLHGVGGSFDVLAGVTRRAPERWQRLGLEWAYRLVQEPGRLWRRYLRTNSLFVLRVARERVRPTPPYVPSGASHG